VDKNIILETKGLKKTFPAKGKNKEVTAVKGIDLKVKKGKIFGFLGPNGAGKTTSLQMLTTLLKPTSGNAMIVGFDLLKEPQKIRKHIGYVSQAGGSDTSTNAYENLMLQAQLFGIDKKSAQKRILNLIERFELKEFAERKVTSYSGGQRRRLDLALGIIHSPKIIFLDEPTTGLDPQSRNHFWNEIRSVKADGTTVFLTTHYLDEADNLCDFLSIMDHGTIVAEGTPSDLKKNTGGGSIIIETKSEKDLQKSHNLLEKEKYVDKIYISENKLYVYIKESEKLIADVLRFLDKGKIQIQSIELSKPSLDDVFLQTTGRSLRDEK
jgi:ABC-2 type transport system ATP-binding protein